MPALPYFVIMVSSFVLSFFMPLPRVNIDAIPFELSLPTPYFTNLAPPEIFLLLVKMIGYAMMLGVIDVIEQVMSNVAIEKMDPMKRKADSNNSLLAIWIANMGATFFGGMTNLDGLAKSTTNTVAGAVTKLSNLFTALVIFLVVLFPVVLEHLPEYALGIIMVYSGYKMIANIAHVRSEGRYALIMAGICGLLVFKLGIFEGLLTLLAVHAVIQFVFMKRMGKTNTEILEVFKGAFGLEEDSIAVEIEEKIQEPSVPILDKWIAAINGSDSNALVKLYADDALVISDFSAKIRRNKDQIKEMYQDLFKKDELQVIPYQVSTQKINGLKLDNGQYKMQWKSNSLEESSCLRFLFVIQKGKIISHYSSVELDENLVDLRSDRNLENVFA